MNNIRYPMITELAKHFNKPILIFDLETTGLMNVRPVGIVEIAILIIKPDGALKSLLKRVHPGIAIPYQATRVHNIRDSDVKNLPKFDHLIPTIVKQFEQCVISGFNSNSYDIPVLEHNYERYGYDSKVNDIRVDVRSIWMKYSKSRKGTLTTVSETLNVPSGTAHSALGDIETTANIFEKLLEIIGIDSFIREYIQTIPSPISKNPTSNATPYVSNKDDNSKKTWETRKKDLSPYINEHLLKNDFLLPKDFESISKQANVSINAISFALSEMIENKSVDINKLIDTEQQLHITKHFLSVLKIVGSTSKLSPIKNNLDLLSGFNIDYIQIKIYLLKNNK